METEPGLAGTGAGWKYRPEVAEQLRRVKVTVICETRKMVKSRFLSIFDVLGFLVICRCKNRVFAESGDTRGCRISGGRPGGRISPQNGLF